MLEDRIQMTFEGGFLLGTWSRLLTGFGRLKASLSS